VRNKILKAAAACGQSVRNKGIYWQTEGPRLETRAEIQMISQFADLVGMTMAAEAVAACEIGLHYASLCSVDNFANGIANEALAMETIRRYAHRNAKTMQKIVIQYVGMYGKK
jgi:5'-methylthioadenosine phosphorylase